MWFSAGDGRLQLEQDVLADLQAEGWLKDVTWHIDEERQSVHVDVDMLAGDKWWEARIVYPFIYPFAPPQVMPRAKERWSSHQWGRGGELCLEIRADNWHSSLNSADMLRSAHKLLETESSVDETGAPREVLSDHRFTEGQLLAWEPFRLVLTDELIAEAQRRGPVISILELSKVRHDLALVFTGVALLGDRLYDEWIDDGLPKQFGAQSLPMGRIANLEEGSAAQLALAADGATSHELWRHFSDIPLDGPKVIIGVLPTKIVAKFLGLDEVIDMAIIPMDNQPRIPARNDALKGKRVAIVGCGSMGSKVAASLVRCGVSDFLLFDGDVLKPGNLVRNELDWFEVGAHKTDGLIARLRAINPRVLVDSWKGRLDGQHSTATIMAALEKLGKCDLIVETSASGPGFAVAAAVATQKQIPMVWGRVFGGGYGGYIVRSRPGIEFPPLDVRHHVYMAMTDPSLPKPPDDNDIDYGSENDDQEVMVADDADVSILSGYLSRLAIDTLRPTSESDYPASGYLIGLREEWIFETAFETRPIILPRVQAEASND